MTPVQPVTQDLRGFVEFLEERHPEEVVRIRKEVDPVFGVSRILDRLEKDGKFPLVIFEKLKGSSMPLIANMHASVSRLQLALGLKKGPVKEFLEEFHRRESNPVPPEMVETGPVKEVVKTGGEVDLAEIPACMYHEKDAGKYITAGLCLTRDPDSGVNNIGVYRLMVKDRNRLGIQISETAHGHYIWKKFEHKGLPCPMAVVVGHHPAFYMGSLTYMPPDTDELEIAGGILQKPVQLVKCETIPLEVPADAEIVLECESIPRIREEEAPFGEYPGTYGPMRMNPVLKVKAITHRRDPLYQNAFVAHPDNLLVNGVIRATVIENNVKIACPTVRAAHMPRAGRFRFMCYVAIEKMIEGEGKQAAMAAFVTDPHLKFVVVVDHDMDITNDTEVLHAIATRVRGDTDIFIVPYAKGSPLDPASIDPVGGSHLVTKVGIDATRKSNYPEEISVPGSDRINLKEFIEGYEA